MIIINSNTIKDFTHDYGLLIIAFLLVFVIYLLCIYFINRNYNHRLTKYKMIDEQIEIYNLYGFKKRYNEISHKIKKCSIISLDIKNFNNLSEYLGYEKAINILKIMVDEIQSKLTKREIIARLERDHFILEILENEEESVKKVIASFEESIFKSISKNNQYLELQIKWGVFIYANEKPIEKAIDNSIQALNQTKKQNTHIEFYTAEIFEKQSLKIVLDQSKEEAFKNGEFIGYLQPKVSLKTNKIVGAEILVRWKSEKRLIEYTPNQFIPIFEQNGFIKEIDMEMLRQVCIIQDSWKKRGMQILPVSFNLSRVHFTDLGFIDKIKAIIKEYNANPKYIELEITESIFLENMDMVGDAITKLHEMGIRVSMDDFGSGYSSLSSLHNLDIDTLKIDGCFVKDNLAIDRDIAILSNMINLANELDLEVVVEGVETVEIVKKIKTISDDVIIQGYYFSKPVPQSRFDMLLEKNYQVEYEDSNEQVKFNAKTINAIENDNLLVQMALNKEKEELLNKKIEEFNLKQEELERKIKALEELKKNTIIPEEIVVQEEIIIPETKNKEVEDLEKKILETRLKAEQEELIRKEKETKWQATQEELERRILETRLKAEQEERERQAKLTNPEEINKLVQELIDPEVIDPKQQAAEQALADETLVLDVSLISKVTNTKDDEDENESTDEEDSIKDIPVPTISNEEVEKIIKEYYAKYNEKWYIHAEEELGEQYFEIISALRYYKGADNRDLAEKIYTAEEDIKVAYNILKNHIMQYVDVKNRISKSYDSFRVNREYFIKISFVGKKLRLYLDLDPDKYPRGQYPHADASKFKKHAKTPFMMRVRSGLSVRRAKILISDVMTKNQLEVDDTYKPVDYVHAFKYYKKPSIKEIESTK